MHFFSDTYDLGQYMDDLRTEVRYDAREDVMERLHFLRTSLINHIATNFSQRDANNLADCENVSDVLHMKGLYESCPAEDCAPFFMELFEMHDCLASSDCLQHDKLKYVDEMEKYLRLAVLHAFQSRSVSASIVSQKPRKPRFKTAIMEAVKRILADGGGNLSAREVFERIPDADEEGLRLSNPATGWEYEVYRDEERVIERRWNGRGKESVEAVSSNSLRRYVTIAKKDRQN